MEKQKIDDLKTVLIEWYKIINSLAPELIKPEHEEIVLAYHQNMIRSPRQHQWEQSQIGLQCIYCEEVLPTADGDTDKLMQTECPGRPDDHIDVSSNL